MSVKEPGRFHTSRRPFAATPHDESPEPPLLPLRPRTPSEEPPGRRSIPPPDGRTPLLLDLDGTMAPESPYDPITCEVLERPPPYDGLAEALDALKATGRYEMYVWTGRWLPKSISEANAWVKEHDLPLLGVLAKVHPDLQYSPRAIAAWKMSLIPFEPGRSILVDDLLYVVTAGIARGDLGLWFDKSQPDWRTFPSEVGLL